MDRSEQLKQLRSEYKSCLNNVRATAYSLREAINALITTISVQNNCYVLNDTNNNNYLNNLLDKERSAYSNITDSIIPEINNKIYDLDIQIEEALQEEAAAEGGK